MRGGTWQGGFELGCHAGLSPLARGNHDWLAVFELAVGSIPACAGEPVPSGRSARKSRVYPRLRGGTTSLRGGDAASKGLSPLARGNLPDPARRTAAQGSIPACAGEPPLKIRVEQQRRVYPRLRGGTASIRCATSSGRGLSPLARGNRAAAWLTRPRSGSIPACAGEPTPSCCPSSGARVYPRLRGGTRRGASHGLPLPGLSPLARGNLERAAQCRGREGSIPACAGEPAHLHGPNCSTRVYPRLRGGTNQSLKIIVGHWGLSPLARGNRRLLAAARAQPGSIPACAGEP